MKISIAQTKPFKGDLNRNIESHKKLIDLAIAKQAKLIIFPELSLSGYESELAEALAIDLDDRRLGTFQEISDSENIIIGVGAPIKANTGICIGMVLFQPQQPRQLYAKKYLHPDEEAFFVSGQSTTTCIGEAPKIALAICYELSVPEHSEQAYTAGATVYIASVAKSAAGVEKAGESLADIARKYSMTVCMSNCVGYCDNFESVGKSAIWNQQGNIVGQLKDNTDEGIIIFDTETQAVIEY